MDVINTYDEEHDTIEHRFKDKVTKEIFQFDKDIPEEAKLCTYCKYYYKKEDDFYPKCNLSNDLQLYHHIQNGSFDDLTLDEQTMLRLSMDPVTWAKVELNWIARWYQKDILSCSALKKVLRIGRRAGKSSSLCVDILHKAVTQLYAEKPIGWEPGQPRKYNILVVCPGQSQIDLIWGQLQELIQNSSTIPSLIEHQKITPHHYMKFVNGSIIRAFTAGTQTKSDAKKIRGQDADCFVAGTLVNTNEFSVRPIETLNLKTGIFGGDQEHLFKSDIQYLNTRDDVDVISVGTVLSNTVCTPEHPFFDGVKDVPAEDAEYMILSSAHQNLTFGNQNIIARLVGYNFGAGWISGDQTGFSGQEEDLQQVVEDLTFLGDIRHKISVSKKSNEKLGISDTVAEIKSTIITPLFKKLGVPIGRKVIQSLRVPEWIRTGSLYIKASFLSGLFSATGKTQKNGKTPIAPAIRMRSQKKEWLLTWFNDIKQLLNDLNIKSSIYAPKYIEEDRWTLDIVIDNSKIHLDRFVDLIGYCYNVKKRISANQYKLYRYYQECWNKESWKLNRLVRNSNYTTSHIAYKYNIPLNTVKYHKKLYDPLYSEQLKTRPEVLEFYHWKDGYLRLPVTKTSRRTAGKAKVYNLQSGAANRYFANGYLVHNCIYCDEADYLSDKDMQAILAILLSRKSCRLWMSSTPTGLRNLFWKYVTNKKLEFKEFHYPSQVSPTYDDSTELFFRELYDENTYRHEVLAEFGEASSGVFRNSDIDACIALERYNYNDCYADPPYSLVKTNCQRIMGVDWNEQAGIHAVINEWWPREEKIKLVAKKIIPASNFRLIDATNELIQWFLEWHCNYMFCDRQAGTMSIEMFHKYGQKHPETLLHKRVIPVEFNSKLEIKDPYLENNKWDKKPTKPLVINITARRIEKHQCLFPENEVHNRYKMGGIDSSVKSLIPELRNFHIVKYNAAGVPIYSQGEDHTIIAWCCSVFGIVRMYTDYLQIRKAPVKCNFEIIDTKPIDVRPEQAFYDPRKSPSQWVIPRQSNRRFNSRGFTEGGRKRRSF